MRRIGSFSIHICFPYPTPKWFLCLNLAIMFNVDHPFSLYSFISLCCFSFFFSSSSLDRAEQNAGGSREDWNSWRWNEKKSAIWASGLGGEAECATTRQRWRPLLLIENFFFNYLSVLALSPATEKEKEREREREKERERETAEGLSSFLERSNWLHRATRGKRRETETTDRLETCADVTTFNRSVRRLLSAAVTSLLAYRALLTRQQRLKTQDICWNSLLSPRASSVTCTPCRLWIKLTTACQIWTNSVLHAGQDKRGNSFPQLTFDKDSLSHNKQILNG